MVDAMNEDEAAQAIDKIVDGPGTKAHRARQLFKLGCDRTDVAELLGMSYSQAHSIWKTEGYNGQEGSSGSATNRAVRGSVQSHRQDDTNGAVAVRQGYRGALRLSPSQTRFITQDGHIIVRVDKEGGPVCRQCERRLTFSLRHLGFIHTDSKNEPTDMEDRYE